ncbi:MAG: type VI secretion system protein TssA [Pseudomonadota bacterium]
MFTLEKLLAPLNEQQPCGADLAFSPEYDAIAQARLSDDPALAQGAWVAVLRQADWQLVASRCAELIETRSKDLQLAAWLAEASAKTAGLRALGDSLLLVAALCERYWEQLHPLPDEDGFEQRIGKLCWIAARAPRLVQEVALTEGAGTAFSMLDFEAARSRASAGGGPDLDAARRNSSRAFYETLLADGAHCLAAFGALEKVIDERLGADGPGFTKARATLEGVLHFIAPAAREAGALTQKAPPAAASAVVALHPGQLQERAQALAQLRQVAEFFRRTEPHSPVAYLADKAADWGDQPLHLWLRGVVKDPGALAHFEELLGV